MLWFQTKETETEKAGDAKVEVTAGLWNRWVGDDLWPDLLERIADIVTLDMALTLVQSASDALGRTSTPLIHSSVARSWHS